MGISQRRGVPFWGGSQAYDPVLFLSLTGDGTARAGYATPCRQALRFGYRRLRLGAACDLIEDPTSRV